LLSHRPGEKKLQQEAIETETELISRAAYGVLDSKDIAWPSHSRMPATAATSTHILLELTWTRIAKEDDDGDDDDDEGVTKRIRSSRR